MLILGFDSTAAAASCALLEISDGKQRLLGENFVNVKQTHSVTLLPMAEDMLKYAGTELQDIDIFAVNAGPGSFTGVRIGVSAVKGMAYGLSKPCKGVSTLHSLAYNLSGFHCLACPVMDARCGQFYNALFSVNGSVIKRLTPDRAISAQELSSELAGYDEPIVFVGDGAELAFDKIRLKNTEIAPLTVRFQRASSVCLASMEYEEKSARAIQPVYLRLPQAERERLAKLSETEKIQR